jgi:hypothetical protein
MICCNTLCVKINLPVLDEEDVECTDVVFPCKIVSHVWAYEVEKGAGLGKGSGQ